MRFKITHVQEAMFDRTEPSIESITFEPVLEGKQTIPPARSLVARHCHSEGAPKVGDEFIFMPIELWEQLTGPKAQDAPPAS
jgi:hypothetical protein